MKRVTLFLPVLTAIFLTLSLYAANSARLGWDELLWPMAASLAVGFLYMGLFSLHPKIQGVMPFTATVFTAATLLWYLITPYGGIALVIVALLPVFWRRLKVKPVGNVLTFGVIIACGFSLGFGIVNHAANASYAKSPGIEVINAGNQPNIYFIVPDRMPSPDAMRASGLDPSALVTTLRQRGFYVKEDAVSADEYTAKYDGNDVQTTRTMRFFASVLNLGEYVPVNVNYKDCRQMISSPGIIDVLHGKGYTFENVASWFAETKKMQADYTYTYPHRSLLETFYDGELVEVFWGRSIFCGLNVREWQTDAATGKIERDRHIWQMVKIKELMPGKSRFIMAHIMLPHEPFVWAADGLPETNKTLTIPEQYIEQIKFTADYIVQLADNLRRADPTAIIIFQSDEGMAYKQPVELNYDLTPLQWSGVFTAWYIPGADEAEMEQLQHTEILRYILE